VRHACPLHPAGRGNALSDGGQEDLIKETLLSAFACVDQRESGFSSSVTVTSQFLTPMIFPSKACRAVHPEAQARGGSKLSITFSRLCAASIELGVVRASPRTVAQNGPSHLSASLPRCGHHNFMACMFSSL